MCAPGGLRPRFPERGARVVQEVGDGAAGEREVGQARSPAEQEVVVLEVAGASPRNRIRRARIRRKRPNDRIGWTFERDREAHDVDR